MSYIDLAIGLGFFLFFIALVLGLSIQHFIQAPAGLTIEEYGEIAVTMFNEFFSSMGTPSNWENTGSAPSELGLIKRIYKAQITVEEPGTSARTNEPVIVYMAFDEECSSNSWNDTVRVYDSNLNEHQYELVNPVVCSSQFLNESYLRFKVNISQNEKKTFYVYYYEDSGIPGPNYTVSYSTTGWVPSSGDSWTEATTDWTRHGGDSGTVQNDTSKSKMRGLASVQMQDTFDSEKLGLEYNPSSSITGVSNGWYIDAWIYVDDLSGVSSVNVSISNSTDTIMSSISSSSMSSGEWYHFERELSQANWGNWTDFDASSGLDYIRLYMVNSSAGITRELRVDEVHFELNPLQAKVFPEETETVISSKKISAMNNLTYSQLRDVTGENYRFRVEIIE